MTMSYQTESESEKECDSRNRQELVWTTVRVSIHWHSRGFSQVGITEREERWRGVFLIMKYIAARHYS